MSETGDSRIPSYRRHKSSGQAIVTLNGKDHLLGRYGTVASRQKYNRLITEWLVNGRRLPAPEAPVLVAEVLAAYWRHAQAYYRHSDGTPTGELNSLKGAMRFCAKLYRDTAAADFGPLSLKAARQAMIEHGLARGVINNHVNRIRRVFKWAAGNEMIPASVWHGLAAVEGLRAGRSAARETEPVKPVPVENVQAILPHVSPQVAALIQLQLLTGARPGEICAIRGMDLDTSGQVWVYTPRQHKTLHHGHARQIPIGPRAQAIIRPFLLADLELPLFSPREAERIRREKMHASRKTPLSYGNSPGSNRKRKPRWKPSHEYTAASYRRAITRACEAAGVPHWHPHQLRHTRATDLRKQYGIESAGVMLGHRNLNVTEIYAEKDLAQAMRIAGEVG
ncbi:MAG: site-specific integrase [Phycisphaerales bacterium]|nr:site-specific integrase [Phycisphaerales bacterium]